jgi:sugar phosphate isomerase/epimerase
MNRLGLEYLTLLGVRPDAFVRIAAEAGCAHVALMPALPDFAPSGSQPWSLLDDPVLRRETKAALADTGVSLALMDGLALFPHSTADSHRRTIEVAAELGTTRLNTISAVEWRRTLDETGPLVAMAADYGMTVTVEPCPLLTAATLAKALELIAYVDLPNFKLLLDTMHVARTGEAGDLAALDPALIDYVQISDASLAMPSLNTYFDEAVHERMIPGTGELPLIEMLAAVRDEVVVSAEVPLRSLRERGVGERERARLVVEGTRQVLAVATR